MINGIKLGLAVCMILMGKLCWADPGAEQWMQFRGPGGAGVLHAGVRLPFDLNVPGVRRWRSNMPAGHSSPIIVGNRIFLIGYENFKLLTLCVDLENGAEIWRKEITVNSLEKTHPQHGPASCTPVSDGKRVVVSFGSLGTLCYDLDGVELWRHESPVANNMFGTAASPILMQNSCIVYAGDDQQSLIEKLDLSTGKVVWQRQRSGPASGWSTPVLYKSSTGLQILFYEPYHLRAIDEDGKDLWSVPGLADEPITVPQISGDLILVTSYNLRTNQEATSLPEFQQLLAECDANRDGAIDANEAKTNRSILSRPDADGQGDHPLRMFFRMLDKDKSGDISATEWPEIKSWIEPWKHANGVVAIRPGTANEPAQLLWQQASGVPECPTPLVWQDHVLMVRNGGLVSALKAQTGNIEFQERLAGGGPYYASPVMGDDKVYLASARGHLSILTVRPWPPKQLSTHDLGERIMATPALCEKGLVVRSEKSLWLFSIPTDLKP